MESVYIHIPFCKSICSYCDFCKMLYNGSWVTQYLNALIEEIKDKYDGEVIKTLYIGGGTPSSLSLKDLKYLFEIVKQFNLTELEEFTFECNLNDLNEELLQFLLDNGVNRLSIGIESFNEDKLKFMERHHTFLEAEEKFKLMRKMGFNNINIDLIYGIPGETLKDLKKDLELFLKLEPDHISTYSLIVEDNTKIGINGVIPIPEELDASMYEEICEKLDMKRYEHYEVSNFAKKGKKSKHNLKYWNNEEYYGFGLGAAGYTNGVRYENTRSLTEYINGKRRKKEEILSIEDKMYNELMLGFRKMEGINLKDFFIKYGVNMQEVFDLHEVLKNEELIVDGEYIYVNPEYIYVMNEILVKIL
ncbi:MAG TPA: radical SAM family heme chaperone HemW [Candidatus Coprovivens excrementavium]|nr:radical SAM family heme chaperone HemW [Candidatus Coprovivens excrementavium]